MLRYLQCNAINDTLGFPSYIATLLVSADARGRSAHDVAQTEGDA